MPGERPIVFLYGTMKRGFYNYNAYLSCAIDRGQAEFLCMARTMASYDLVLWGDRDVPGMLDSRPVEGGNQVVGEMFCVDQKTLAALDDFFEDGSRTYLRRVIKVEPIGTTSKEHNPNNSSFKRDFMSRLRKTYAMARHRRPVHHEDVYCYLLQPEDNGCEDSDRVLQEYTTVHHEKYSNPYFQPNVLELMTGIDAGYFRSFWEGTTKNAGKIECAGCQHTSTNSSTTKQSSVETSALPHAHLEESFEDVWREALGHPPKFKRQRGIRLHDFSLNHIPNTPLVLSLFKCGGFCCWLIGPLSAAYVIWLWRDFMLAQFSDLLWGNFEHSYSNNSTVQHLRHRLGISTDFDWSFGDLLYTLLHIWVHLEVMFLMYMQVAMYWYGQSDGKRGPPVYLSRKRREANFKKFVATELADRTRGREWISSFFLKAKYRDLRRENLRLFWAMRLFESNSVAPDALTPDHLADIERYVDTTIECLGDDGPALPGMNKEVIMFNARFDKFQASHHPLFFYFFTEFLIEMCISWVVLWWLGFHRFKQNGIKYWHRPAPSSGPDSRQKLLPILMFPGVGVGFLPYKPFFKRLSQDREVFLVELPYISLRILGGFNVFSTEKIRSFIHAVCAKHGIGARGLDLVGHSFGTSCVANCMKGEISRAFVNQVTMIDPVSFAMQSGDLLRDFLYDPYEDGRIYLVNREPHLAHVVMRALRWYDCILWPEDIAKWHKPPLIILSGNDTIVPSTKIKEMLMREETKSLNKKSAEQWGGYTILWLSDTDHGGFLFDPRVLEEVVSNVNNSPDLRPGTRYLYKLVYPA